MTANVASQGQRFTKGKAMGSRGPLDLYKGWDHHADQPVTFQVLSQSAQFDDHARARFRREFRAARQIRSPFVCRYLSLVADDETGFPAMVTESQEQMSLASVLAMRSNLTVEEAVFIARQLAMGLADCHRAGVIHRDLRPEHILLDDRKNVKIINFGLSHLVRATALTATGLLMVSPDYAPPEAFTSSSFDIRADIYAFGVIIWEILAGFNPFDGLNIQEIMEKKCTGEFPEIQSINPDIPLWLSRLCDQLTHLDPENRPASMAPVIDALEYASSLTRESTTKPKTEGCCLYCGHPKHKSLPFCGHCGEVPGGGEVSQNMAVILEAGNLSVLESFLQQTFPQQNELNLKRLLQRPTISLGADFTKGEANWLVARCRELGCATRMVSARVFTFKLNTIIMALILNLIVMAFMYDLAASTRSLEPYWGIEQMIYPTPYWIRFIGPVVFLLFFLFWYFKNHFISWYQIPREWYLGLFESIPKGESALSRIAKMIFLAVWFTGFIAYGTYFLTMAQWPLKYEYPDDIAASLQRSVYLFAAAFLPRLLMGPPMIPRLFTSRQREENQKDYQFRSGLKLFKTLRRTLREVPIPEYRYILEKMTHSYLEIRAITTGKVMGARARIRELQEEAELAFHKVLQGGIELEALLAESKDEATSPWGINASQQQIRYLLNHYRVVLGALNTTLLRLRRFSGNPNMGPEIEKTLLLLVSEVKPLEETKL